MRSKGTKNKSKKELLKVNSKGITLVALVVTIVVLLILAGITINLILGQNSIFNSANEAKNKTGQAAFEEKLGMVYTDAMLERGVSGGLTSEKYFEILKNHGIISDTTVPGGNISSLTENADGSKTYKITSEDDYIFEVTIYPDGKVETEVIGKDGSIEAKVKSIAVTNKTQTSISIRVSARLQGGEVKAYYKKVSDIVANEPEDSTDGYTEITLNDNLEGTATPLTAGEEYKIKVILIKDGETVNVKSINETATPLILVNSITLNKTSLILEVGDKETLTAKIAPENADNKNVTWDSSNKTVATVSQTGEISALAVGETTITVTAQDDGEKSTSCTVTVESDEPKEITYSWGELNEIAKAISNTSLETYNEDTEKISVTINGTKKRLKVGDWKTLEGKKVRILGFNHDTLAEGESYEGGSVTGRAGISFEYTEFLGGTYAMNSTNTSINGWGGNPFGTNASNMRTYLNGTETGAEATIGGEAANLTSIQNYIKRVKKPYLLGNGSETVLYSDDWLWLLSCSEIWASGRGNGAAYGYAKAKEGEQYKYYKKLSPDGSSNTTCRSLQKPVWNFAGDWWLRSPYYKGDGTFCGVNSSGYSNYYGAMDTSRYVTPGFCI